MDFTPSPRAQDYLARIRGFMHEHVLPVEESYFRDLLARNHAGDWTLWRTSPLVEELKAKARDAGLWNLFLPDPKLGAGFSWRCARVIRRKTQHGLGFSLVW